MRDTLTFDVSLCVLATLILNKELTYSGTAINEMCDIKPST